MDGATESWMSKYKSTIYLRIFSGYANGDASGPLLGKRRSVPISKTTSKLETFKRRLPYYIPVLSWLPAYKKENVLHDFIAGVSAGTMLVPQGLSYAIIAGLPPIVGLYTSCIPVIVYALLGNSRQVSVGPEALVSMIVGSTLTEITHKHMDITTADLPALAHLLSFLVGLFMLVLGLLRFGFLSEVLSRPILQGFIIALALTIAVEQLDTMLGMHLDVRGWRTIPAVIENLSQIQWLAFGFSIASVSILFLFKILKKYIKPNHPRVMMRILCRFPDILLVVILGTIITATLRLDMRGLSILGSNPSGLPKPILPLIFHTEYVGPLIEPAIIISIIGLVETMTVGKKFAAKYNYRVSANREFVAVGIANIVGSFFQAWPIFGSLPRSSVNDNAGARTQLAGFIAAMVIVGTLLFLLPAFYFLPRVVMSSIILVAAIGLLEVHEIIFLWRVKAWKDLIQLVITALITFIYGATIGLLLSVGASVFMVIKHTSVPHISILGRIPNTHKFKDIMQFKNAETQNGILVLRVEESLHFANMERLKEILYRLESVGAVDNHPTDPAAPPLRSVIIDAHAIPHVDSSSLLVLYEVIEQYKTRGIRVCFVRLRQDHKIAFSDAGILQLMGGENFFDSLSDAVVEVDRGGASVERSIN